MNEIKNIKKIPSKILAGYIIAYRLLGIYKDRNILCMQELMDRRNNGDNFNFEEYIDNEIKNSPKPGDLSLISNILKM